MTDLEIRSVPFEMGATTGNTITGRAVVFNSMSKTLRTDRGDVFQETFAPGAFTRSLKESPDVRALKEHNPMFLLGRTSSGTLKLEERADGLHVSLDLPDTTYANDLKESIKRGDISGFSFGFKPVKQRTYLRSEMKIRELLDVNLSEVSLVSCPAYNETDVSLRSEGIVWEGEKVTAHVSAEEQANIIQRHRHYNNLLRGQASSLVIKQ